MLREETESGTKSGDHVKYDDRDGEGGSRTDDGGNVGRADGSRGFLRDMALFP